MAVLKTTSPERSAGAPKLLPSKTVPSSKARIAESNSRSSCAWGNFHCIGWWSARLKSDLKKRSQFSSCCSDALRLRGLMRDEKIVADGQGQSDLSPRVPGHQQCGRLRG